MDKKIQVDIKGRIVRIEEHMLEDVLRFGATRVTRITKETPKELIKAVHPLAETPATPSPLPDMKLTEPVEAKRKTPVRSKSKK